MHKRDYTIKKQWDVVPTKPGNIYICTLEAIDNNGKKIIDDAPVKSQAARKRETRVGSCTETPVLPATG